MAGGRETPRQKMIGMMYLVLTALLALNVSKAILDAFVSIEENIQKANETEYYRGTAKMEELESVARSDDNAEKAARAKKILKVIDEIDRITGDRIQEIDQLKIQVLSACGEDMKVVGPGNILLTKFDPKKPIIPIKMDLNMVKGQDKYDESMNILIGEDIKQPKGKGLKMWENLQQFKTKMCDLVANYTSIDGQKQFNLRTPDIRKFKDQKDLNNQLSVAFEKFNVNPEDKETVIKIYSTIAKNERSTVHEVPNVHWVGKTFDHSPVVASIASLSSLQKEILSARADAISLLFGRVGGGEYTFNKIIALAYGPELVASGERVNVEVLMAAYDSDINPKVTMNGNAVDQIQNGKGQISLQASRPGDMMLNGTISITNKHGVEKRLPWQKNIKVMQPMGAISIPAFNVLYLGYENELSATVSGYDQTILAGENVDVIQKGNKWVAHPKKGYRDCKITIYGKNSVTGTKVNLGTIDYRISRMPKPMLLLGATEDGGQIVRGTKNLIVKYPIEVPLQAPFEILEWQMDVPNVPVPSPKGPGSELNTKALELINMAPRGQSFDIIVKVRDKSNSVSFIRASFKK